jgi:glycosyltransferase involved in cell wall biosynthesis
MTDEPRRLHLAVYGFVSRNGGSVASANFLLLDRLLSLGHTVEFHGIGGAHVPEGLIGRPGFTYTPTSVRPVLAGWRAMEAAVPRRLRAVPTVVYAQLSNALHERAIGREVARRHAARPYDALVCLGLRAPFRVPGLPALSWPQGAPQTEWESLKSLRPVLRRYASPGLYQGLGALYRYKQATARRQLPFSDLILCGSRWTAARWVEFGAAPGAVLPLPYAFEVDTFSPAHRDPEPDGSTTFRFLWLGRIVPRKRLDLLLEAFQLLRAERPDVELLIVGAFGYARGYRRLLDEYAHVGGITHLSGVPRGEVPSLFRRVDAVVQPSENEDIGSAPLEALCCGIPSVVGPTNGTLDYLGDSAEVFDSYTPDSLKSSLSRMIDRVLSDRAAVSSSARASAEHFLTVDTVVSQFLDALRAVISRHGSAVVG